MVGLSYTHHAKVRCAQRGIDNWLISMVLTYGRTQYDHHGGRRVFLGKPEKQRVAEEYPDLMRRYGRKLDLVVVTPADCDRTVMTAYALKQAGHSLSDVDLRLIATDDGQAVFEDPEVAALATWEPMMSEIVNNTSRKGSKILLSSKDFNGLITDVVIANKVSYENNREKYAKLMRGIYRAIDLYKSDPDAFLESAAPTYDVTPEIMKGDLAGVYYTSYEDALEFFGVGGRDSKLKQVVDGLTEINIELDLMDEPIAYEVMVDPSLTDGLFDGHQR